MHKHKLTLALIMICALLVISGFGNVRSTRGMALPIISTTHAHPNVELDEKLKQFGNFLSEMQQELAIPGMSAVIVKDQSLIWSQGFGYADAAAGRKATPDTPYEIASLTKPLSAVILLQLVEQGRVNLDDPISKYGIHIKSPGVIRVKHLLGHTSQGQPGSIFLYNGDRYGRCLQKVIERASGKPFQSLFMETILDPLGMSDSIPIDMVDQPAYAHIQDKLSRPYGSNQAYIDGLSAGWGLVSTVLDLAKFDMALDQDRLIKPETKALAFTAQTLSSGDLPVYGLGWFVQDFQGTKMVWHYGYDAFSHLYLKFVDQDYTLILFTNSSTVAYYTSGLDWNVLRIPAALTFYKLFIRNIGLSEPVYWDARDEVIAAQLQAAKETGTSEIARQEIHNRYLTNWILERKAPAQKMLDTYIQFFATREPPDFTSQLPITKIDRVTNDTYSIVEFTLEKDTRVNIYAVGEYWLGKMVDYGGIEDVSSRKLIWEMTPERTSPAGGCAINRQATDQIDLRASTYRLHYRTDWGHSFDSWDGLPPDNLFWGIALYSLDEEASVPTRTITPTSKDELLVGLLPLANTPVISNPEYFFLWVCLGILLSVLMTVPLLFWRKKNLAGITTSTWRWARAAGWTAWVNSLLCLALILVTVMIAGHLEYIVENPLILTSNATIDVRLFVGASYLCIFLTILQALLAVLAWKGKRQSFLERFYYFLVTIAASGYLLLLGSWGLIATVN